MSLIQAALDKTQGKVAALPPVEKKPQVRNTSISNLKTLDREIEKKVLEVQKPSVAVPVSRKYHFLFAACLGVFFAAAFLLWQQAREGADATPSSTVTIERANLISKPGLAQKVQQKVFPSAADASGLFYLTGIAWGGSQPYAVINGQILRAGDQLDKNVLVQAIEKEHVVLDSRGELIRLALNTR